MAVEMHLVKQMAVEMHLVHCLLLVLLLVLVWVLVHKAAEPRQGYLPASQHKFR